MNREEILIAIKEIQCRYSLPALERNFTDKDYACKQYEKLVIQLANQQEKKNREIETLHSIIKEVREYITSHREAVDERGEHIIYFLTDDFDEKDILEILDKENI